MITYQYLRTFIVLNYTSWFLLITIQVQEFLNKDFMEMFPWWYYPRDYRRNYLEFAKCYSISY